MTGFDRQVDGDHYSKLGIQPMFFCTTNGYDPALFSVFKYCARFEDKGKERDLEKAMHCVELREAMIARPMFFDVWPLALAAHLVDWVVNRARQTAAPWRLSMSTYIDVNEIRDECKAHVLLAIEAYSHGLIPGGILIEKIRQLKESHYGDKKVV